MTLEGWIFMVGLRVFDVGALIVWLVWFFKLRDEDDDDPADGEDRRDGGSQTPEPPPRLPGGPPDLALPKPDAEPWPRRRRDHGGDAPPATRPVRRVPQREPARAPARQGSGALQRTT